MATLVQILENTLQNENARLPNETKRVLLKATLQAFVLDYLYNHREYRQLNFYGGTCLKVIYQLNRLSEDIDLDNGREILLDTLADDLTAYFQQRVGFREISIKKQQGQGGILRLTLKFPVLYALGLSPYLDEQLHLKVEVSQHKQVAIIQRTPVLYLGRSFVPAHFSLETMMAGKILACLERNFQAGKTTAMIKGRDFYDLLWFMQQRVQPLEEKLVKDGQQSYTTQTAMETLREKIALITPKDLAVDLYPMFEQRTYIEAWVESFQENFQRYVGYYLGTS
jgi:predicted nucleotidyltransferase component of viral defense system